MSSETDREFLTYLLLFATHADFKFDAEERAHILSKVDESTFNKVNRTFEKQNDIQRIDRIRYYMEKGNYSQADVATLTSEVVKLFKSDGDYSMLEHNLMIGLKRIMKG